MKNIKVSLILNIIIVLFVTIGTIFMFNGIEFMSNTKILESTGFGAFKFYTVDSNVLVAIGSFILIINEILVLNNKKDKLLELVMEEYLTKVDYKKQVDLINEEINIHQNKINELQSNKKDKNYIENKINSIKEALNNSLNDIECYSDIFNELVDRIYVFKENDKKIKLDILLATGESLYTTSDNSGKKFHSLDYVTTSNSSKCSC